MESREFLHFRKKLRKTQDEMAKLLGVSVKAVRSYEQGWRSVPSHVERQILFLSAKKEDALAPQQPCWVIKNCKAANREKCPAWEFKAGTLCWFLYGTECNNGDHQTWKEKIKLCQNCSAFPSTLKNLFQRTSDQKPDESCFSKHE
ncbi:MAG: helix-turn-helix domain-containing protein [Desulfobacterales bacterium]|jgi:DNA-binding XRE family transcriptional regulator|nr:helix-turn-helix domain-containing protein [Desulfobacterales bacterium]